MVYRGGASPIRRQPGIVGRNDIDPLDGSTRTGDDSSIDMIEILFKTDTPFDSGSKEEFKGLINKAYKIESFFASSDQTSETVVAKDCMADNAETDCTDNDMLAVTVRVPHIIMGHISYVAELQLETKH